MVNLSPGEGKDLLRVEDIVLKYGGVTALNRVSLTVPDGQVVGLIGPNGSGKSSMINLISGIYRGPFGGTIRFAGMDLAKVPAADRVRHGMSRIFQGIRLFDTLTVEQNILLGAHSRFRGSLTGSVLRTPKARRELKRERERVREVMSMFGTRLTPRAGDQVLSLSYANRRRVELSRALMSSPRFLLLDEPTAGMNPHETEELTGQLQELHRSTGVGMLLVEHKMDVINGLCDHVYALDAGAIIAEGSPGDVQNDPAVLEAFLG